MGWVKAKVVCRGEGALKVSPPLPPQKILIIHVGAPAQKSVAGDTNANIFWKLYTGKFFETTCCKIFWKLYAGKFFETICWKIFWKLYAGKYLETICWEIVWKLCAGKFGWMPEAF